ncbi:hypothetical protein PR001_g26985, partial [Phytophthora rubi]
MNISQYLDFSLRNLIARSAHSALWGEPREPVVAGDLQSPLKEKSDAMPGGTQKAMSGRLPVEAFIYSDRRVNLGPENVNMLISLYWDRMEKKS